MDIDLILNILMVVGGVGVAFFSFMKIFADRADEILEELRQIKEKLDKKD